MRSASPTVQANNTVHLEHSNPAAAATGSSSKPHLQEVDAVCQLLAAHSQDASCHIRVAANELGGCTSGRGGAGWKGLGDAAGRWVRWGRRLQHRQQRASLALLASHAGPGLCSPIAHPGSRPCAPPGPAAAQQDTSMCIHSRTANNQSRNSPKMAPRLPPAAPEVIAMSAPRSSGR